nr:copia protein [Tanacetum cinerariifolium]
DGANLDKMKEKADACIFVGYSTQSRAYRVFNKRTRVIVETIHVNFDELPQMASDHVSSDLAPKLTTSNELDLLFSPMFDELLNGSSKVVSKSSAASTADAPNQRQQHTTPLNTHTTPESTFKNDEFINIFCTPVQDRGETSSRHVDSSNMHTFYQHHPSEHRWTKDHSLEQLIGNPSQSVRTRRQLESDGEICMFALTMSRTEPKNIKEAMADSAWIEWMQEELHQFDRLDIHQSPCGIFINQAKYAQEILIKHGMTSCDSVGTPMATKRRDADMSGTPVDQTKYHNSDHAGCLYSRKSTSGGIQFLGRDKLVSWSSKKQDCTLTSSVEAEYVSLSACCSQVLWMRTQLTDYGFHFDIIPMYCDSKAAIAISCNPVQHSHTKHIDVIYHFIKEKVENGIVELFFVRTEYQLADLFTKALPEERFKSKRGIQKIKQLIDELPMLRAPKEKEELIMYLAAAKEAISAVLMTKRDGKQVPIYFVSRALQG